MKHVEFYSKNKFEKLVHLVGFIIRTDGGSVTIKLLRQMFRVRNKLYTKDSYFTWKTLQPT